MSAATEFDRHTDVRPLGEGRFAVNLDAGWAVGAGLNGGYQLSVVGNAIRAALPQQPDPIVLSAYYLAPAQAGPATVEVTVRPENLRPHAKGRTVDFVSEVTSGGELVWEGRSTYLRRGPSDGQVDPDAPSGTVFDEVEPSGTTWSLPGDLGRRYAAVSGDRNPIHLYPLTARALGFKRQIAHGMWSKARSVAAIENRLPDRVSVEVAFKTPVFLPGAAQFRAETTETGTAFSLVNPRNGAPHLHGRAH